MLSLISTGCDASTEEEHFGSSLLNPHATIDPTVYSVEGPVTSGIISVLPAEDELSLSISSSDGRYTTTWPSISAYPMREPYRPGRYIVDAFMGSESQEGFDSPYFFGRQIVDMTSGQTTSADIVCHLANSVFNIDFSDRFVSFFTDPQATVHSSGGGYFTFTPTEARKAYLRPGKISLILNLTMPSGETVEFMAATISEALEQHFYDIDIDVDDQSASYPKVIISFDSRVTDTDVTIDLTPEFIASRPPVITPVGFTENTDYELTEGDTPDHRVGFDIAGSNVTSLLLTTMSEDLIALGWPAECDLATADAATINTMKSLGLKLTGSGRNISSVDLTDALGRLRTTSPDPTFILSASNSVGKLAGPSRLHIALSPADIKISYISNAIMGLNVANIRLLTRATDLQDHLTIETQAETNSLWTKTEIISIEPVQDQSGEWDVTFKIPDARTKNVNIRVIYCDEEKYSGKILFSSPEFDIDVDAFARTAIVAINARDPKLTDIITSMATIYVNGEPNSYLTRLTDKGIIIVGGLNASTHYEFKATLFDRQSAEGNFSNAVTVTTENTLSVPNGGFEDVKDGIHYKDLPAGGRYSQNIVDIFNQQNYVSYDQYVPKKWANVNAKTFCRSASRHNTWYMQPSTYSITNCMEGAYAVCLQTTAWDLNGPAIADYRQESQPYTNYSRNIPTIANRAAGKIFLGEYGFDPTTGNEAYIEGVSFSSRPTSLNGYYKLIPSLPSANERGFIRIEIIGNLSGSEIVIASGEQKLNAVSDYTAFNIPLTYTDFKIKATKLKIMIASSDHIGTIDLESAEIETYSNPVTSTSYGATLWIDNLTFSY